MGYVWMVLAGAFLVNCIPHLTAGLRGEPFPTPFARPPARGLSSPRTNMLWGSGNLAIGIVLTRTGWPMLQPAAAISAAALGWLSLGWYLAGHFGEVRAAWAMSEPRSRDH